MNEYDKNPSEYFLGGEMLGGEMLAGEMLGGEMLGGEMLGGENWNIQYNGVNVDLWQNEYILFDEALIFLVVPRETDHLFLPPPAFKFFVILNPLIYKL